MIKKLFFETLLIFKTLFVVFWLYLTAYAIMQSIETQKSNLLGIIILIDLIVAIYFLFIKKSK